jgi:hypothetical protein
VRLSGHENCRPRTMMMRSSYAECQLYRKQIRRSGWHRSSGTGTSMFNIRPLLNYHRLPMAISRGRGDGQGLTRGNSSRALHSQPTGSGSRARQPSSRAARQQQQQTVVAGMACTSQ